MKKLNKLAIKKVTLRNLDELKLEVMAGGLTGPGPTSCPQICHTLQETACFKC